MFEPGDHAMWQSEYGEIGPVKILARHGNVSYELGLLSPSDLKRANGLKSTVFAWKVRACTKKEKRTLAVRLEEVRLDDDAEDVDMEDFVDDVPINAAADEDEERVEYGTDDAADAPMADDPEMDDSRTRRSQVSFSDDQDMPRNDSRSQAAATQRRQQMLDQDQASEPASDGTPELIRQQVPRSLNALLNDDSPPNHLSSGSDLPQNSPQHHEMTNMRKNQARRHKTPTEENTPGSRKGVLPWTQIHQYSPKVVVSPPRQNNRTPEQQLTTPSLAGQDDAVEVEILSSRFHKATPVPLTNVRGVVHYKVKHSKGRESSVRHTEVPLDMVSQFQEWHADHPRTKAPKLWEAEIRKLRRERGLGVEDTEEDDEEDGDEE